MSTGIMVPAGVALGATDKAYLFFLKKSATELFRNKSYTAKVLAEDRMVTINWGALLIKWFEIFNGNMALEGITRLGL